MIKYIAAALALSGCAVAPSAPPEGVNWLDGCWQSDDGRFKEVWTTQDGVSKGEGTVMRAGQIISSEEMTIQQVPDFYFEATPTGSATTRFEGVSRDVSEAGWSLGFSSASHDYPQIINYVRTVDQSGDRLMASISLSDGTKYRAFEYRRCPKG